MTPAAKDATKKDASKDAEKDNEKDNTGNGSHSKALDDMDKQAQGNTPPATPEGEITDPVETDPLHNPQSQEQGDPRDGAPPALTDQNGDLPADPENDEAPEGHTKVEVLEEVQHSDVNGSFRLRTGEFVNLPDETAKKLIKAGQVKKA